MIDTYCDFNLCAYSFLGNFDSALCFMPVNFLSSERIMLKHRLLVEQIHVYRSRKAIVLAKNYEYFPIYLL